ncbi:MAG: pilus assembly protein TadG-related protein [Rhizobiaceae bacterium]
MTALKTISSQFLKSAARFSADKKGAFAPTIGVTIMAAALCAGIAVDYTRMMQARTVVDDALDAAILAAGTELSGGGKTDAEIRQVFDDFLESNLENRNITPDQVDVVDFQIDQEEGRVSAKTNTDVDMAFMGLMGTTSVAIGSGTEARFSTDSVEVAMVLDVTGSMRGGKIRALKRAATDAVNILIPEDTKSDKMRIGLVPYSWSVNAGRYASKASGGASRKCVTERLGKEEYSDAPVTRRKNIVGAQTRNCPNQDIQALTNNRKALIRDISGYDAVGSTAGQIGIAWGYYMLSENWQNMWPKDSDPADYTDPVKKIAIVMTDGEFNTVYNGQQLNYLERVAASSYSATQICADMKAPKGAGDGIIIYSIAFKAPKSAQQTLKTCASSDSGSTTHYFSADNEQELRLAFQKIAIDIQKLRLSQ